MNGELLPRNAAGRPSSLQRRRHKWLAMCVGCLTMYVYIRDKKDGIMRKLTGAAQDGEAVWHQFFAGWRLSGRQIMPLADAVRHPVPKNLRRQSSMLRKRSCLLCRALDGGRGEAALAACWRSAGQHDECAVLVHEVRSAPPPMRRVGRPGWWRISGGGFQGPTRPI